MAQPTLLNGAYQLVRSVDAGATARVYQAIEVATGKKVAVKLLRKELSSQKEFVARFEREALLLQQLDHPNVAKFIRMVNGPEGLYLLLEWVEGQRLDHHLRDVGTLPGDVALSVLLQVARALAAMHQAGIVHRDLKPENVMVESTKHGLVARLLDLGIARFADAGRAAATFQTLQGQVAGTPTYLSPEQIQGKPAAASADVYAFGILAFVVLTGQAPFRNPDLHALMHQHLSERPPKLVPSEPSLAKHPVVAMVTLCLEKDPRHRPQDAGALVGLLEAAPPVRRT